MPNPVLTRRHAWAIAWDAGERSRLDAGRRCWSSEDHAVATREFARLWPLEYDLAGPPEAETR